MIADIELEYWLRGPVQGVAALLQPVAHALLQANAEIKDAVKECPVDKLWQQPAGVASVAFHLQHIAGVLDRLFTYSKNELLTTEQLNYLKKEGIENNSPTAELVAALEKQIITSVEYLKTVNANTLCEERKVGRKQLPSTVAGLLFHAAEHTMRHTGQLLVTIKILQHSN